MNRTNPFHFPPMTAMAASSPQVKVRFVIGSHLHACPYLNVIVRTRGDCVRAVLDERAARVVGGHRHRAEQAESRQHQRAGALGADELAIRVEL